MATVERPPLFSPRTDRPSPQTNTWTPRALLTTTLRSQDKFFGVAGNPPDWDMLQVPKEARPYGVHLRTWLNPVNLNLLNKDRQFAGAGQWKDYDYPTPKERVYLNTLRTFTNSLNLNLLNKDRQFAGAGQWKDYDYPTPKLRPSSIDLLTWINPAVQTVPPFPENLPVFELPPKLTPPSPQLRDWISPVPLNLLSKDQFFNAPGQGPNYLYPTPPERPRNVELRTWVSIPNLTLSTSALPNPVSVTELVPKLTAPSIQLRSWGNAVPLNLLGQDQFFGAPGQGPNYLYPTPAARTYHNDLRSWTSIPFLPLLRPIFSSTTELTPRLTLQNPELRNWVSTALNTLLQTIAPIFSSVTELAPRLTPPSIQLREWIKTTPLNLLGQDQFFGAPGQGPNYLYPTPSERAKSADLRTWISIPNLTLAALAPIFTSLTDLVPKSTAPNIELRNWINTVALNLLSKDQFFGAPGQPPAYLYPTPSERPYPINLRTWTPQQSPALAAQFPFVGSVFELAPKLTASTLDLRTWTPQANEQLLALPPLSSIITALAPDGRPISIQLKSWVNQVPLNLLGQDQFFGAAGQGPQILDWSYPKSIQRPIEIYVHVAIGQQNVTVLVTGVLATGAIGTVTVSIPPPAGGDDQNKVRVGIVRSAYLSDNPSIGGMF